MVGAAPCNAVGCDCLVDGMKEQWRPDEGAKAEAVSARDERRTSNTTTKQFFIVVVMFVNDICDIIGSHVSWPSLRSLHDSFIQYLGLTHSRLRFEASARHTEIRNNQSQDLIVKSNGLRYNY
jgi:hypothetical protein